MADLGVALRGGVDHTLTMTSNRGPYLDDDLKRVYTWTLTATDLYLGVALRGGVDQGRGLAHLRFEARLGGFGDALARLDDEAREEGPVVALVGHLAEQKEKNIQIKKNTPPPDAAIGSNKAGFVPWHSAMPAMAKSTRARTHAEGPGVNGDVSCTRTQTPCPPTRTPFLTSL